MEFMATTVKNPRIVFEPHQNSRMIRRGYSRFSKKKNQIDFRNQGENPCTKYRVIGYRRVGVNGDNKEKSNISPDGGKKIHQGWEKYRENNAAVGKVPR